MKLEFIDIQTIAPMSHEPRQVSLSLGRDGIFLLGNLEHNTQIIVDQKLVDQLQQAINQQKGQ